MIINTNHSSCRGFSIVELMVALLLFMVAVLGLAPLLTSNMHADARNQLRAEARDVAMEKMDWLQALEFEDSELDVGKSTKNPRGNFRVETTVSANTGTTSDKQKKITVLVEWPYKGRTYNYQLVTVRTGK